VKSRCASEYSGSAEYSAEPYSAEGVHVRLGVDMSRLSRAEADTGLAMVWPWHELRWRVDACEGVAGMVDVLIQGGVRDVCGVWLTINLVFVFRKCWCVISYGEKV